MKLNDAYGWVDELLGLYYIPKDRAEGGDDGDYDTPPTTATWHQTLAFYVEQRMRKADGKPD